MLVWIWFEIFLCLTKSERFFLFDPRTKWSWCANPEQFFAGFTEQSFLTRENKKVHAIMVKNLTTTCTLIKNDTSITKRDFCEFLQNFEIIGKSLIQNERITKIANCG